MLAKFLRLLGRTRPAVGRDSGAGVTAADAGGSVAPGGPADGYRALYPLWMWRCAVLLPHPSLLDSTDPAEARPPDASVGAP